jgi:YidC/Oxa1 family membrane protein insertase
MWETLIIQPMTNLLLLIYDLLGHGPHTFGIAIILFTIVVRAITWPLNASQVKGAQAMQELQNDKAWQDIQKKYAKDREKLAQEQMRIYRERGINPFASCLPTLIQFPIIIGLYQSIIRAMASTPLDMLKLARTIYSTLSAENIIPLNSKFLWMDLGSPEAIPFPFGIEIPFLPLGFPTLAIIVALTTYIQTKLTMPATPPNPNDQAASQTAAMSGMMSIYMPLLLGWFALTFASGISVYFITSNLLGILQYAATGRANWRNLLPGGKKQVTTKR